MIRKRFIVLLVLTGIFAGIFSWWRLLPGVSRQQIPEDVAALVHVRVSALRSTPVGRAVDQSLTRQGFDFFRLAMQLNGIDRISEITLLGHEDWWAVYLNGSFRQDTVIQKLFGKTAQTVETLEDIEFRTLTSRAKGVFFSHRGFAFTQKDQLLLIEAATEAALQQAVRSILLKDSPKLSSSSPMASVLSAKPWRYGSGAVLSTSTLGAREGRLLMPIYQTENPDGSVMAQSTRLTFERAADHFWVSSVSKLAFSISKSGDDLATVCRLTMDSIESAAELEAEVLQIKDLLTTAKISPGDPLWLAGALAVTRQDTIITLSFTVTPALAAAFFGNEALNTLLPEPELHPLRLSRVP